MDVKNANLNSDLIEEVYMQPPLGSSVLSIKVCKLCHALYERGIILLLLYMDDIIITGDDTLGLLSYFLSLEISHNPSSYFLTQAKYIFDLLTHLVGSLVYLTVTCPDIAYAIHIASQLMVVPRSSHYGALIRILSYLKGTMFHGDSLIAWYRKKQTLVARFSKYRALADTTQELV
ncbi:uncharacterized protein LOC114261879 [Camellia sinensis]|uniref:uncharacterized protein LOC114261879 n=1 Tax=Camellia sinensis TaxID=4442 RepID=UPI00103571C6|nr:uncharacterized protein LOC114261879 [Camellia sinensis]